MVYPVPVSGNRTNKGAVDHEHHSDPVRPHLSQHDERGAGGIPGSIVPNERSLALLPVALAHETNHNVRGSSCSGAAGVKELNTCEGFKLRASRRTVLNYLQTIHS